MTDASGALVIFGITGDLAYKQIFPALQAMIKRGQLNVPIVGVARTGNLDRLRARARDSLNTHGGVDEKAFEQLSASLQYVTGDYQNLATFERLRAALRDSPRPLHYLAVPSLLFERVVAGLAKSGCAKDARVVVEKPFGRDLASAQALNCTLH
jgi:glucose-6-phosphate 1-dehydrogenase